MKSEFVSTADLFKALTAMRDSYKKSADEQDDSESNDVANICEAHEKACQAALDALKDKS